MKHARKDYDRIQDPAGLIAEDEPVFLLRAQDIFASRTIEFWAAELGNAGGDPKAVVAALQQANRMRRWGLHNVTKTPDVPPNTCGNCGRSFAEGEEWRRHLAEPCKW